MVLRALLRTVQKCRLHSSPACDMSYVLGNPRAAEQLERLPYVTSSEMLDGFRSLSTRFCSIPSSIPLFIYKYSAFLWMNSAHRVTVCSLLLLRQWELSRKFRRRLRSEISGVVFVLNHELRSQFRSKLANISDIERLASRIAWRRADSRDLLTLAQSIERLPSLAELIEGASSNLYFDAASHTPISAVQWANNVRNMLAEDLGNGVQAGKVVKSGVDPTLDVLRQKVQEKMIWLGEYEKQERLRLGIPSLEVGFNKIIGHYISIRKNKLKEDSVPDDYQRLQSLKAEERFVTSTLLDCESSRLAAEAKVYDREEELFKEEMVSLLESVRKYSQAVATLDVLCTFADLAVKRDYCRPHMLETGREITIIGGRHPVVELALSEDMCFVANSSYLGFDPASEKTSAIEGTKGDEKLSEPETMEELTDENEKWWPRADLVLLTGPNASGKSCYLRQIGLIQLIAQAGRFVPAKFTRLSLADGLYTRVGAVDDLAAGQSTFRVEMVESANILNRATAHSLVLLDEVGRGTSSQEGGVIAREGWPATFFRSCSSAAARHHTSNTILSNQPVVIY